MSFLNPAFLFGLPLVAVPVVIHLLSRRQQKKISWGAMRFLTQAATRRRRLWRLTDFLLLLLRTLAFLVLIFALSRPLLPVAWLGGAVPREVILVLDQSMSMSRRVGEVSLFDRQLQLAGSLLEELKGSDSVRVLLAGESPEWLTADPVAANPSALRELRRQLEQLKPTLGAGDLIGCVREAADLDVPKDKSGRAIIVLSDGQRFGWRLDERPLWEAVQSRVRKSSIPTAVRLQFIPGSEAEAGNLCVNRIESPRVAGTVDQPLTFTAHVQNRGPAASQATLLGWRVHNESAGVTTVPELAPGASTSLSLSHQFSSPGVAEVTCQIEARDAMAGDNDGHLLVEIVARLPILLVEDVLSGEPLESDSAFLLAALGARKPLGSVDAWRSVFEPSVIGSAGLATADLNRFRCVILADPREVAPDAIAKLESYVQSGGGVWIALGARTDIGLFNERFYRGGLGLAPAKLATPVGDPNNREAFFAVRASSETHPATSLLADVQRLDLDRARIYRRHQFDQAEGADVSVLLQVQPGDPVAIERKLDRGRVLVQSIPLGVSWSTLPLCQAYVAMVHEWLWYLAEPGLPRRNLAAGETMVERTTATDAIGELTLPDQRVIALPLDAGSGGPQFRFAGTRLPGAYSLRLNPKATSPTTARFVVRRNPEESDLRPWTEKDLEQLRLTKEIQLGAGLGGISPEGRIEVPKHPLDGWLLIALPFVLMGELMLAGWATHRRNLRVEPVTMNG